MFLLSRPAGADPREIQARPLFIRDFLVWIALCAVSLAAIRPYLQQFDAIGLAFITMDCVCQAVALLSIACLFSQRTKKIVFPWHPGEWLLLIHGTTGLVQTGAFCIGAIGHEELAEGIIGISAWITCPLYAVAATRAGPSQGWRIALGWVGLTQPLISLTSIPLPWISYSSYLVLQASVVGGLLLMVVADLFRRVYLPWTHWCGIVVVIGAMLAQLVAFLHFVG